MTRVVVTGAAGFLGSHLCERLLEEGYHVVGLDNLLTGTLDNVEHLRRHPRFRITKCDVSEYVYVPEPVDHVLHFASPASPVDYLKLPIETLKVGSLGTLNALELAHEKGARFLLASTSETYGDPQVHPQPESYWGHVNPVGPRGVYDEAKRYAEALTTAYRSFHGLDTAIVRIFNTFGPRMRPDDGRAIPTFIRQALAGEALTVAGDGMQTRSVCYVSDTVDGILRLMHSGHPGPVNIGNPEEMTVQDLARLVLRVTGSRSPLTFVPRPQDDPQVRRPDIGLAAEVLGWLPRVPVGEGMTRTVRWFRARHGVPAGS